MQKTALALTLATSLLLTLSACQPSSDPTGKSDSTATNTIKQKQKATPIDVAQPTTVASTAIDAQTCIALNKAMQKIGSTSKIEAIYAIQQQLEACLPTANNAEVLALLKNYQALYERFLGPDNYMDDEDFYAIVETMEAGKKVTAEQLEVLAPRIQYLVKLVETKADVSILYIGEGIFVFHHDLKAMADIFTPYLAKDQQVFIQQMAKDNQQIFWNDAAIDISFDEVIARAEFWQDYIQRYPNSSFIADGNILFDFYRHALFFGSDNTQWTDDAVHEFISPEYEQAMQKLAKRANSILARDARSLFKFMAMSDSQRQQTYPVPEFDEDGDEIQEWSKVRHQLKMALPIPLSLPWEEDGNRECSNGIICVDYNVE
ncbi:septin family protein [Psychrobacter sp. BF1]|uniref:septin family protein n=1 Tax=Psychrobacter sp. BF1 TaxID=2821147 RepID=UPI001C4E2A78|nr:septin family protein [Psychrobacter sp. BF1]